MKVERQVVSIFVGTNGYLDEIPIDQVQRFESEFLEMMDLKYGSLLSEIAEKKDLSEDLQKKLHAAAKEFLEIFKA